MDIKDRIKLLMEHESMTAAAFAESIGVAQATISHTLGDRNKYPSTDFIIKLHERFNHISLDWLLTGKGEMINDKRDIVSLVDTPPSLFGDEILNKKTNASEKCNETVLETSLGGTKNIVRQDIIYKELPAKKITEIRVFFDDNTYQIFKPEK